MRCAIWYHLYNLKKVKNTHGGVLILVKLQAEACNFTKINTPPWEFLICSQIALSTSLCDRFFNIGSGQDSSALRKSGFLKSAIEQRG